MVMSLPKTNNSLVEQIDGFHNHSIQATGISNWSHRLPAISSAFKTSYYRVLGCSPAELAFRCNMLHPSLKYNTNELLETATGRQKKRQRRWQKKISQESTSTTPSLGMKAFIKHINPSKTQPRFSGPYKILQVNANVTCVLDVHSIHETINIRRLKPFLEKHVGRGECRITNNRIIDERVQCRSMRL
ncbi:hypothetical protein ROZALSC1DRAFT_23934 [Rozella allomycis CSF55]|uniref:Uncharacterized protein n=1 Tax=Rozella allomycis (strain CSF55) TaxID=988480 RepID=A0A4P9YE74_ROZAC|nr:hypothetical protein ROZALSC1DRAFT_23934 [Rozella allomycis CSF55]